MFSRVAIVGDGGMATACAMVLADRGAEVTMWSPFPDHLAEMAQTGRNDRYLDGTPLPARLRLAAEAAKAFEGADLILSTTPTPFLRKTWRELAQAAPANVPVCSVTKGIENQTLDRPSQIIRQELGGDRPVVVLSGQIGRAHV